MKKIVLLLSWCLCTILYANAQDANAGKEIFTQRCTSCHAVGKQVVGPDLMNVDQERSETWIINFVHSSQTVIKGGDTAAVRLFGEFGKTIMPDHPDLKDQDIKNIIAFIKEESARVKDMPKGNGNLPDAPPIYKVDNPNDLIHKMIFLDVNGQFKPMYFHHYFFWTALAGTIILLVTALLFAVKLADIKEEKKRKSI